MQRVPNCAKWFSLFAKCPNGWSDRNGRGIIRRVSTSRRWRCLLRIDRRHLAHADWHTPYLFALSFIFRLFANKVRTAGLLRLGDGLINVFQHPKADSACWESIGGTWHMSIAIGTILIFSLFANNVRTAGLIGLGEALIDVFLPPEDEGTYIRSPERGIRKSAEVAARWSSVYMLAIIQIISI